MRKPRSDSKLLNLPDERKSEDSAICWTRRVSSLKDARAALARDFGIQSSPASLSHFYSQEKAKRVIARRVESLSWLRNRRSAAERELGAREQFGPGR
jgi:hypothetical protein